MRPYLLLVLPLCLAPVAAIAADTDIREGLWEVSVQAEVGGQPLSATPMVVRQCVSNQSSQDLMAQTGGAGACQISDFQRNGNHAQWKLTCSGSMDVSGTGETDIADDQFSGKMDLVIKMGGESMPMAQTFKAHRVGACQ
jgi:hypothetical protein